MAHLTFFWTPCETKIVSQYSPDMVINHNFCFSGLNNGHIKHWKVTHFHRIWILILLTIYMSVQDYRKMADCTAPKVTIAYSTNRSLVLIFFSPSLISTNVTFKIVFWEGLIFHKRGVRKMCRTRLSNSIPSQGPRTKRLFPHNATL